MTKVKRTDFQSRTDGNLKKVFIEIYGCQMNVADS
jgi:hypothetical protein